MQFLLRDLVKQLLVQILVIKANIHMRLCTAEVEKRSMLKALDIS